MLKVLFVCHGNICRSPMAEFLFKRMVEEKGVEKNLQQLLLKKSEILYIMVRKKY